MPELPEVETVVDGLRRAGITGRRIADVRVFRPQSILPETEKSLRSKLAGRRILAIRRRAKYICMPLQGGAWMLVHLRMTGRLCPLPADAAPDPHDRVIWQLDDGRELRLHDPRAFARVSLTEGPAAPPLSGLGPEPLEPGFSGRRLADLLQRARRIKPLLLDQRAIAGIGNIYADEALWEAAIHPARRADSLAPGETGRLHRAIRRVLRRAVRAGGTALGGGHANFLDPAQAWGGYAANLRVFRRQGRPCPRCRTAIERILVAQRATHFCPTCQRP